MKKILIIVLTLFALTLSGCEVSEDKITKLDEDEVINEVVEKVEDEVEDEVLVVVPNSDDNFQTDFSIDLDWDNNPIINEEVDTAAEIVVLYDALTSRLFQIRTEKYSFDEYYLLEDQLEDGDKILIDDFIIENEFSIYESYMLGYLQEMFRMRYLGDFDSFVEGEDFIVEDATYNVIMNENSLHYKMIDTGDTPRHNEFKFTLFEDDSFMYESYARSTRDVGGSEYYTTVLSDVGVVSTYVSFSDFSVGIDKTVLDIQNKTYRNTVLTKDGIREFKRFIDFNSLENIQLYYGSTIDSMNSDVPEESEYESILFLDDNFLKSIKYKVAKTDGVEDESRLHYYLPNGIEWSHIENKVLYMDTTELFEINDFNTLGYSVVLEGPLTEYQLSNPESGLISSDFSLNQLNALTEYLSIYKDLYGYNDDSIILNGTEYFTLEELTAEFMTMVPDSYR